ncbi:MAG TPA: tRNA pseudouridine(55) synthase TruB, partial [Gemmatimonadaceae bacterium]|nr:tRNA pseudouridine(55) synthase TruB [Gemmatimonadaceae bacterium]
MGTRTDGLLLVDKPAGISSHDVVAIARRALRIKKIGHAGTLDPFATGLLVLLTGRATRLMPYVDDEPKEYEATIAFGSETDTDDRTGTPTRTAPAPDEPTVRAAIPALTGGIAQVPPAYSAKQVEGTRAYDAARRGEPLALAPVRVTVHAWRDVILAD